MAGINPFGDHGSTVLNYHGCTLTIEEDQMRCVLNVTMTHREFVSYRVIPFSTWENVGSQKAILDDMYRSLVAMLKEQEPDMNNTPRFTKKHYDVIAQVLKNATSHINTMPGDSTDMQLGATMVVSALIEAFKGDNPRFDKRTFIAAMSKE